MKLSESIIQYIESHSDEALQLLIELAQIPAPPNQEDLRASFCKKWLQAQGAEGVYVDEACNVIYPVGCAEGKPIAVFAAHSDVVFPDLEPLPLKVEDGYIHCPGVGDDTGNVVALLMAAKYIAPHSFMAAVTASLRPPLPIMPRNPHSRISRGEYASMRPLVVGPALPMGLPGGAGQGPAK